MNDLKIFEHERFGKIRTLEIDGEPWFNTSDICKALDLGNPTNAVKRLDEDEHTLISIKGANGENRAVNFVNESGLYSLILGSRKKEAHDFKRWVTHEVLPSIRETGGYLTEAAKAAIIEDVKAAVIAAIRPPRVVPQVDPAKLAALLEHTRKEMIDAGATPYEIIDASVGFMEQFGVSVPWAFRKYWRKPELPESTDFTPLDLMDFLR